MELRHLRYFLAVCEELHFGRAAKRVHISQPPLSQQIKQLEEELHVKLFYRTRRKVELTDAGRVFAGEARLILEQVENAARLALESTRSIQNRLVVSCSPANSYIVIKVLRAFRERYPETHVVVKNRVTPQQIEAVRNGHIDVGFVTLPVEGESLAVVPILREKLVVAMPSKHPLAARRGLSLRSLANDTLIIFPLHMSPGRYELITGMCRRAGFSLHVIHEVDNVPMMLDLISAGFGVSLMRASVTEVPRKGVVFRELHHSPIVETGIIFRSENTIGALPLLVDLSKEIMRSPELDKPVRRKPQ